MNSCRWCSCPRLKRSSRTGNTEALISLAGIYPYKCARCSRRSLRVNWIKSMASASVALAVTAAFAVIYVTQIRQSSAAASAARRNALSRKATGIRSGMILANQDIVALTGSGVAAKTIVTLIDRHPCRFDASPAEMLRMTNSGVDQEVVQAVAANADHCETGPQPVSSVTQVSDVGEVPAPTAVRASAALN